MAELNVRKRGTKWEYRFEGAKIEGKRNQISKGGFRTKAEATQEGTQSLAEYNKAGQRFTSSEISVSDYMDYWLKNYCEINLKYNTIEAYRNIIKKHIKPKIGMYRLNSITTLNLQEFINGIYVEKNFTKAFMKNILVILKGSFKYAVTTAKFIQINPAIDVSIPKYDAPEKSKMIVLSNEGIAAILKRFNNTPYHYYALLIGYYTGLRISEVYGLTWDNIDFEKKTLTVNKIAIKMNQDKKNKAGGIRGKAITKWYFGTPKTPTSYRTIEIGDTLINALRDYKIWQDENEKKYDEFYIRHYIKEEKATNGKTLTRIISADSTMPISLDEIKIIMVKDSGEFQGTDAMKYPSKIIHYELGFEFNFHSLRHTHATILIENGAAVKAVSERLGHANTNVTLNTYCHNTDKMKSEAVNIFEGIAILPTNKK